MQENKYPTYPILLVSPDRDITQSYAAILEANAISNTLEAHTIREAGSVIDHHELEAVVLDMSCDAELAGAFLVYVIEKFPHIPVIVVTDGNNPDCAIRCMNIGAFDFIVKPMEIIRLNSSVLRVLEHRRLMDENLHLKERMIGDSQGEFDVFKPIITGNSAMKSIFCYIEAIAPTAQPVLIYGETGVGKELIARAIAQLSGRQGEYVTVNVAGLDDNLFSDTLFGHSKGAFTSAVGERKGLIEKAAGGTLFLDEIGDLSFASQIKLLRLLQEGEYYPIGSDEIKRTDVRILVATHKDLNKMQQAGEFRTDLYYRLNAHQITIPPLRRRLDDLPLLVDHFLTKAAHELGRRKPTSPPELFDLLAAYHFPGNIRELRSMVFEAVTSHTARVLSLSTFRNHISSNRETVHNEKQEKTVQPFSVDECQFPTLKEATLNLISQAMDRANGNQTIAAQLLGITQQALSSRLKRISD
ncbi:MAG: sigma-54 dependent transcriptional regulator [Candidatus Auribacterota bacterium]